MDYLLSGFKWYRRLRGGQWVNFTVRPFPYMNFWKKEPYTLYPMEFLLDREDYTKK